MAWIETVVGGLLAAGAGILVTKWQFRKQDRIRRERWENRLLELLQRFETDIERGDSPSSREVLTFLNTTTTALELLEDHLADAPRELPEGFDRQIRYLRLHVTQLDARTTIGNQDFIENILDIDQTVRAARNFLDFDSNRTS